jgi:outer membrane protein OmpA-like peptidoglycan-associated protein
VEQRRIKGVVRDHLFLTYMRGKQPRRLQLPVRQQQQDSVSLLATLLDSETLRRFRITLGFSAVLFTAAILAPSLLGGLPIVGRQLDTVWSTLAKLVAPQPIPYQPPARPRKPADKRLDQIPSGSSQTPPGGNGAVVTGQLPPTVPPSSSDTPAADAGTPPVASDGTTTSTGSGTPTDQGSAGGTSTIPGTGDGPPANPGSSDTSQQHEPAPVHTFMLFFNFDRVDVTPEAEDVVAEAVKAAPWKSCLVTGHTDTAAGTEDYALSLTQREAESVKETMQKLGFSGEIETVGKGFSDPMIPTGPGVREPQNRRVVIECTL